MENLPSGWAVELLGKLCSITTGSKDVNEGNPVGQYPFFTCAQEISKCNAYSFDGAAILIAGNGNFSVKKYEGKFEAYQRTYVLQNFAIAHNYLFYFISHRLGEITKDNFGSTIRYIRIGNLTDYPVSFPSINEQHRIVAKIEELFSELDQGVASLKTAREQLKVYRQSLLKNAFEGKLTAAWRAAHPDQLETAAALQQRIAHERQARYQQQLADWQTAGQAGPKPKLPKPLPPLTAEELAELPELPDGWVFVRAEEIANFITKGTTPSKELLFSENGEIPFIKVYNLTMTGALDFSIDPTFVSKETHQGFLNRSKVYPGDVLMNIVGPPLGKVSIVPPTYPEWNINQAIAIFRTAAITPKLLAKYLAHETTVRSMMKKSKATAGQFNLTLEICRETLIPLCGKLEQQQIELLIDEKLSEADQLDQTLATALQQADALRQSILKKAFHGQLEKQAKNEEPATALLERIRAGKSNGIKKPVKQRKPG